MENYKKIAIIRRNGLGDMIAALPLIYHCKKKYPEAKITLFLSPLASLLATYLEGIEQVVVFPKRGNRYLQMVKTGLRYRKSVDGKKFDLAISAKPTPMRLVNVFLWALGAKKRVAVTKEKKSFWVNHPIDEKSLKGKHQALRVLQILAPEMQEIPKSYYPKFKVYGTSALVDHALASLRQKSVKTDAPILFVSMSNNRPCSQISVNRYVKFLNEAYKDCAFIVAISCMPKDETSARELSGKLSAPSQVIATDSFDDFMHLVNGVDCLFIGDGGIMHIAAAFDKPQLVLLGHVKKEEWQPLSTKAHTIGSFTDVEFIDESDVLHALKALLNTQKS